MSKKRYYINKETHEIHISNCGHLPTVNKKQLGDFFNCYQAIVYAKSVGYSNADGCYYCNEEYHTK